VDEGAAQRDQRSGEELGIVDVPGGRDGAPHAVETGLDRAGGERRFAGFDPR
jgi:hypothetical protein